MLSRVRHCSLRTSQAFQHLSSKPFPNQFKLFPSSQPQIQSFFTNPKFYFADTGKETKQDIPPLNQQEPKQEQTQTEDVEEIRESFVKFMKRDIKPEEMIYEYSNPNVYSLNYTLHSLAGVRKTYSGLSFVFAGMSAYVFMNISALIAVIPAALSFVFFYTTSITGSLVKTLVTKVELVDPYHINLYISDYRGKAVLCDIKDIQVHGIKEVIPADPHAPITKYALHVTFVESVTGKKFKAMHLPINPNSTSIENMDLFKCIVNGKVDEVGKFRLVKEKDMFSDEFGTSVEKEVSAGKVNKTEKVEKVEEAEEADIAGKAAH